MSETLSHQKILEASKSAYQEAYQIMNNLRKKTADKIKEAIEAREQANIVCEQYRAAGSEYQKLYLEYIAILNSRVDND
jgi:hypothetical protein